MTLQTVIRSREEMVQHWFRLTRDTMPGMARERGWPVQSDHCFQRILLDNAVGHKWNEEIPAPAYRNADDEFLERAIALGEAAIRGDEDLGQLNANSLAWRGK